MTTSNIVQPIPSDLAKWLAGFIEITGGRLPTTDEWAKIVEKVSQATLMQLPTPASKPEVKATETEDATKKASDDVKEAIKKWQDYQGDHIRPTMPYRPWIYPSDGTGTPWAYPPNYPPNYPWNEPIVVD